MSLSIRIRRISYIFRERTLDCRLIKYSKLKQVLLFDGLKISDSFFYIKINQQVILFIIIRGLNQIIVNNTRIKLLSILLLQILITWEYLEAKSIPSFLYFSVQLILGARLLYNQGITLVCFKNLLLCVKDNY